MIVPYQLKETCNAIIAIFFLNSLHLIVFDKIPFDIKTPKSMLA